MQRLFSMFPQGGPGVALLLLRISVVAFLSIAIFNYNGAYYRIVFAAIVLVSISLVIGFLTPFLCWVAAAFVIGKMLINPQASSIFCIIALANIAALGLLGPGAYSVDSKLLGRRRVTVVRPRNSSQSF